MNGIAILNMKNFFSQDSENNSIMESRDEILSRLKFISCIQREEKIDVRKINTLPDTFTTSVLRTFLYNDSRKNTLKFINSVLERVFEILEKDMLQKNYITCKSILLDLNKAKEGMQNLKSTYELDKKFCCNMDVLIEKVDTELQRFKNKYSEVFEAKK